MLKHHVDVFSTLVRTAVTGFMDVAVRRVDRLPIQAYRCVGERIAMPRSRLCFGDPDRGVPVSAVIAG